jgi:chromosome segregation ATPase
MNNMRDQTAEMAMQMKEARERCDSLEEELAEAHRLLTERTREGETMRRLLNDSESRAEAKVRDLKERMEAAVEERDRAEDEASTQGRRRAREMEELKAKVRDAERALRTVEEDKEELEHSQKDWRRRRDELELLAERSTQEVEEIRQAMAGLREALDESEKQVRSLEKDKAELRRSVEESNNRLEKLRKSHKTLGEDVRLRGLESGRQSSRSSIDSGSRRGPLSPSPQDRSASTRRSETPSAGPNTQSIDYMYLKNVLLQFLEQKDKTYQKQLIPVLGMLLHFDRYVCSFLLMIMA